MLNLTKAIWGQLSGSALSAHISNRLFKGEAPEGTEYPYAVYKVVTDTPDHTFTEDYENVIVQFSLFSVLSSTTELENMFTDLITLYDEKSFAVIGSTLVWMRRSTASFQPEEHTTSSGTHRVWAYHVDFEVLTSLD